MPRSLNPLYFKQHCSEAHNHKGFTLIELLVVISIILALASIVVGVQRGVHTKQAVNKGRGEMQAIASALEQFKSRYGDYPWVHDDPEMLLKALTGKARMTSTKNSGSVTVRMEEAGINDVFSTPFIDASKLTLNDDETELLDPWGNPYHYYYRSPGTVSNAAAEFSDWRSPQFILMSKGPDNESDDSDLGINDGKIPKNAIDYFEQEKNGDNLVYNLEY